MSDLDSRLTAILATAGQPVETAGSWHYDTSRSPVLASTTEDEDDENPVLLADMLEADGYFIEGCRCRVVDGADQVETTGCPMHSWIGSVFPT